NRKHARHERRRHCPAAARRHAGDAEARRTAVARGPLCRPAGRAVAGSHADQRGDAGFPAQGAGARRGAGAAGAVHDVHAGRLHTLSVRPPARPGGAMPADAAALLATLPEWAFGFVLVTARIGAAIALLPGLGEAEPPAMLRVGLALGVTALLLPALLPLIP